MQSNKPNKSSIKNLSNSDTSSPDELSDKSDDSFIANQTNQTNEKDKKIQELLDIMQGKQQTSQKIQKSQKVSKAPKDLNSINYDDVEFDKLEENERKALKDLFTGMPDIYKITGTSPEDSQNTINKKCAEKLKMYHPDRHSELIKKIPEDKRAKELKKLDIQFKLLRDADSILRDPVKRKYYDLQKKAIQSKNFVAQKQSFDDFINLQKSKISEQSKALAENDYKITSLTLDQKHGFDRKKFEEVALTEEETHRRLSDLEIGRNQDEIEFVPNNKFENKAWNNKDFNKLFVRNKLKETKKNKKEEKDKSIIVWEDIGAANDFGMGGATEYVSIDHNYEDLYADVNFSGSSLYASKMDSDIESDTNSNSDEFDTIDLVDMDELDGYKFNKEDISNRYSQMMDRRNLEEKEYDNREMHNKESWKSVLDNPFSISAGLGTVLGGQDFSKLDKSRPKKTINKEYADVYKSIVYDGNEEENKGSNKGSNKNVSKGGHNKSLKNKDKKSKKDKK